MKDIVVKSQESNEHENIVQNRLNGNNTRIEEELSSDSDAAESKNQKTDDNRTSNF